MPLLCAVCLPLQLLESSKKYQTLVMKEKTTMMKKAGTITISATECK